MRRILLATAALAVLTGAALAAEPTLGTRLGTTIGEIASALGAENYDVARFERHDDRIEVTAIRDDRRLELKLDPATGEVMAIAAGGRLGAPGRPGVDDAAVQQMLADQGYKVTRYKREGGEIEVYATKDGKTWEIKVDPLTGAILKVEGES